MTIHSVHTVRVLRTLCGAALVDIDGAVDSREAGTTRAPVAALQVGALASVQTGLYRALVDVLRSEGGSQ